MTRKDPKKKKGRLMKLAAFARLKRRDPYVDRTKRRRRRNVNGDGK